MDYFNPIRNFNDIDTYKCQCIIIINCHSTDLVVIFPIILNNTIQTFTVVELTSIY